MRDTTSIETSSFTRSSTLPRQIFATKSIDKLITDSERPEHALHKTLGPVSLTALGIGIVIGSGIFTVIGTAIGGNPAKLADWKDSPVIDLILHHGAVAGRPGAGPALAISLVLVAFVCAFTGLCYAELASMIPIAGSAYTYTYATMGELDRLDHRLGPHPRIRLRQHERLASASPRTSSICSTGSASTSIPNGSRPPILPQGLQDLAGNDIFPAGWHSASTSPPSSSSSSSPSSWCAASASPPAPTTSWC